jgi:hypothetical protein
MTYFTDEIFDRIEYELTLIWKGHEQVGLTGKMCLYTQPEQDPWRAKNPNLRFWFGSEVAEIQKVIRELRFHYDEGRLPNSPLLLNPLVHQINETGRYEPIGSGVMWCTALTLGVNRLQEESVQRIRDLGAFVGIYQRGENDRAGMKILAFSDVMLPVQDHMRKRFKCQFQKKPKLYLTG